MINQTITLTKDTYTVLSALGEGGQASIWKVRRHRDHREFALKSILISTVNKKGHPSFINNKAVTDNCRRANTEIEFLRALANNRKVFIVPCLDYGVMKNERYGDLPTWVMPLYPETLESKMPPYPEGKSLPDFQHCLNWMKQAATALHATHSTYHNKKVFVHRDVKASNMMLTEDQEIRLIDFGIVHETQLNHETKTYSHSPASAAPEQILASSRDQEKGYYSMGTYSDIYALGTVLYRLFTGQHTDAQFLLNNKDTLASHIEKLKEDQVGLIGKVGGLSDDEYKTLYYEVQSRLEDNSTVHNDTLISSVTLNSARQGLPNPQHAAESSADFIRDLLHKAYQKRPTAQDIIQWCNSLQATLSPTLDTLQLTSPQQTLMLGQALQLTLTMEGKGLPANPDWIEFSVNGKPLTNTTYHLQNTNAHYGLIITPKAQWLIHYPASNEAKTLRFLAEASIGGTRYHDSISITFSPSADDLWDQGQYQQALINELRPEWLDQRLDTCHDLEKAFQYRALLETLKQSHPDQTNRLDLYLTKLRERFEQPPSPKKPLKTIIVSLILIIISLSSWFLWQKTPSQQHSIPQLQTDLNGTEEKNQRTAWKQLNRLSQSEHSQAAQTVLDDFTKTSLALIKSQRQQSQQQAIPRLQLMAQSDNKTAMIALADYYYAQSIATHWGKAWQWYHDAEAKNKQESLEKTANALLHNKTSDPKQRQLAYQVVEKSARSEPAGDAAQQWMEYRYRTGDGVDIDLDVAQQWQAIYNGKQ